MVVWKPRSALLFAFTGVLITACTLQGQSSSSGKGGAASPSQGGTVAVNTQLIDETTSSAAGPTVAGGTSVHDTATIVIIAKGGGIPGGGVVYNFYANTACSGSPSSSQPVVVVSGTVPASSSTGSLVTGGYSYEAVFSGDSNYGGVVSTCEVLTVRPAPSPSPSSPTHTVAFTTQVVSDTGAAVLSTLLAGTSVHDTSVPYETQNGLPYPNGTVTYSFFTNGTCSGTPKSTETVTISNFVVPGSASTGPLTQGSYSYGATYGGDSNYAPATASCEPFAVGGSGAAGVSMTTQVINESTGGPVLGPISQGTSVHDTGTTIVPVPGAAAPTGTVSYAFFTNGTCSGAPKSTETVTIAGGVVPPSTSTGSLATGSYSYQATYNGSTSYTSSVGDCETITVQ